MDIRISAVICTHNRSAYLQKAIKSLVNQTLPKEDYEIIIVDNASTDDTKKITEQFSETGNLTYVYEPTLGLSRARNKGWRNSQGEYIAYLDDDAVACCGWLEKIVEVFQTVKPRPGCTGGKVELIYQGPKPKWLSEDISFCLGKLDLSAKPAILENEKYFLCGCNIALPKNLLQEMGGVRENLGRIGVTLLSCEEVLLQKALKKKGYSCFYHPEISIKHYISSVRLTKNWFVNRMRWEGISNAFVRIFDENFSKFKRLGIVIFELLKLLLSLRWIILLVPTDNPRLFTHKCIAAKKIGYIMGVLGIDIKKAHK